MLAIFKGGSNEIEDQNALKVHVKSIRMCATGMDSYAVLQ